MQTRTCGGHGWSQCTSQVGGVEGFREQQRGPGRAGRGGEAGGQACVWGGSGGHRAEVGEEEPRPPARREKASGLSGLGRGTGGAGVTSAKTLGGGKGRAQSRGTSREKWQALENPT